MKKNNRLLACLLAAALSIGATALTVTADSDVAELSPIVDECFDDYDVDYDGQSTTLFPTFVLEANSIGEGYIKVIENEENGNLHLKSHVFTQIYNAEPIKGAYTFSMDVFQTQGNRNCAIFLRAPMCGENAFYEKDGSEDGNAACRTGVVVNCHDTSIDVNIKSYSAKAGATSFIVQNIFTFQLPEGVRIGKGQYTNFKVVDTGTEMSIYVADGLVCRIVFSEPGTSGYTRAEVTEPCFRNAVLYDAAGTEMATVDSPLVQCEGATVGWATRVADMIVDDVYLATEATGTDIPAESETTLETEAESEIESEVESIVESEKESDAESVAESANESVAESAEESADESWKDNESDTAAEESATGATGTTANTDDEAGCASSVATGGLIALMGAAFVALKKKH